MPDADLTPKQQRFVEEFLIDLNATQAAIRSGYAAGSADVTGARLLGNVRIRAAIDAAKARRSEATGITAERVLREYARVAFADLRHVMDWGPDGVTLRPSDALNDDAAAALSEVRQTKDGLAVKLHPKTTALDALARHVGLFDRPVRFGLPALESAGDATTAMAAIVRGLAAGEITPAQAADLSRAVTTYLDAVRTHELERRIADLESAA